MRVCPSLNEKSVWHDECAEELTIPQIREFFSPNPIECHHLYDDIYVMWGLTEKWHNTQHAILVKPDTDKYLKPLFAMFPSKKDHEYALTYIIQDRRWVEPTGRNQFYKKPGKVNDIQCALFRADLCPYYEIYSVWKRIIKLITDTPIVNDLPTTWNAWMLAIGEDMIPQIPCVTAEKEYSIQLNRSGGALANILVTNGDDSRLFRIERYSKRELMKFLKLLEKYKTPSDIYDGYAHRYHYPETRKCDIIEHPLPGAYYNVIIDMKEKTIKEFIHGSHEEPDELLTEYHYP